jgi:hypothetical protein
VTGGQTESDLHGSIRRRQPQRPGRNSSKGEGSYEERDEKKTQQISSFAHDLSRSISRIVRDLPFESRRGVIILLIFGESLAMCGAGMAGSMVAPCIRDGQAVDSRYGAEFWVVF